MNKQRQTHSNPKHNPRHVIFNMLEKRGYFIENKEDFVSSTNEEFMTYKINDQNQKIFVFFPKMTTKVGVVTIRQYMKEMQDNEVQKAIIVVKDAITAFAKQEFAVSKSLQIECFRENELLVDKTKHMIVPPHELLSQLEKNELLSLYSIKESQLPKMLSSDAMARYFKAEKGQVFKIHRTSETCGDYIYYRIVV
jgi:DNA-directed RNA polymerase I, II, and III subunit RPABC1